VAAEDGAVKGVAVEDGPAEGAVAVEAALAPEVVGPTGAVAGATGEGVVQPTTTARVATSERVFVTKLGVTVSEPRSRTSLVWHSGCGSPGQGTNRAPVNHILVVDDDAAIRDVVADILQMSDYRVKTASNGAEALNQVQSDQPLAVLLDLMMPIMDGWEFLRRCRRLPLLKNLPVVVMSAAHDAASAARELGAQAYLTKPFDMDAVLEVVARVAATPRPRQQRNGGVRTQTG
jgi:two-component system, chemotaxis family, chemotaxis protein CheY